MSFWELLGLVVSGAGTLASVLGIFFGVYARQNGRATREFMAAQTRESREELQEFIAAQTRDMREFLAAQTRESREELQEFIAAQTKDMREFLARVLERLDDHITQEGERTREEIRALDRGGR